MTKENFVSYIKTLPVGSPVSETFMVADVFKGVTKRGSDYLSLTLADKTGSLKAKFWDVTPETAALAAQGAVLTFMGTMDSFEQKPQLIASQVWVPPSFDMADFVKTSERSPEAMKDELMALVGTIGDAEMRAFVTAVLNRQEIAEFFSVPAAKAIHHAYAGGLLEHSLSVAKLADVVSGLYGKELNRDLLLAGAILHDLGKCWELTPAPATDYTIKGRLMGHLTMGALFLELVADTFADFPDHKLLLLEHMILAHHGQREKGSPVTPMILEALVLHYLDELDARVNQLSLFIGEETSGEGLELTTFNKVASSFFVSTPRWAPSGDSPPSQSSQAFPEIPAGPGAPPAGEPTPGPGQERRHKPAKAKKSEPFDWSNITLPKKNRPKRPAKTPGPDLPEPPDLPADPGLAAEPADGFYPTPPAAPDLPADPGLAAEPTDGFYPTPPAAPVPLTPGPDPAPMPGFGQSFGQSFLADSDGAIIEPTSEPLPLLGPKPLSLPFSEPLSEPVAAPVNESILVPYPGPVPEPAPVPGQAPNAWPGASLGDLTDQPGDLVEPAPDGKPLPELVPLDSSHMSFGKSLFPGSGPKEYKTEPEFTLTDTPPTKAPLAAATPAEAPLAPVPLTDSPPVASTLAGDSPPAEALSKAKAGSRPREKTSQAREAGREGEPKSEPKVEPKSRLF
ncbi:MAG: HD domain-containing protein [Deltaproteobacteria bacterium]|jgi:3'-5' exoribonuclease|nr:HD domain-containing protein [Deltaproteobacteria bacterium]